MGAEEGHNKVRMMHIDAEFSGQRVDNFLLRELKGVPKTRIYRLLRKGEVRVNKGRVRPDYRLQAGDQLRIPPVRMATQSQPAGVSDALAKRLRAAVLYEDEGLLIINKPSGLAVHGGSGVSLGLIEAVRQLWPEDRFLELVHRLDRETSGCVMIARRRRVLKLLHELLRNNQIDKRYQALVMGQWSKRKRKVELPLQKNVLSSGERMVRVAAQGKPSLTEYQLLATFKRCSLVEAKPVTGRTHQIRVHCQAAGHSILGDVKYGDDENNKLLRQQGLRRMFLHAHSLALTLDDRRIEVVAELDSNLSEILGNADNLL